MVRAPRAKGMGMVGLDLALPDGVFGENLTTEDVDVNGLLIGERWRVGLVADALDREFKEIAGRRTACGAAPRRAGIPRAGWRRASGCGGRGGTRTPGGGRTSGWP